MLLWFKVLTLGIGGAVLLTALSLLIDENLRPDRGTLFLDFKYAAYVLVLAISAFCGIIVSLAALISRSFRNSMALSVLVALVISIGSIRGVIELYARTDHLDAPMFYADVVQILMNLLMYPAICYLIWKLFGAQLTERTDG
jgi:hypothetical protein